MSPPHPIPSFKTFLNSHKLNKMEKKRQTYKAIQQKQLLAPAQQEINFKTTNKLKPFGLHLCSTGSIRIQVEMLPSKVKKSV